MRAPSTHWFKEIQKSRVRDDSDEYPYSIYPWVAPPLHPRLREVIERWAPSSDNNNVPAYAKSVAALLDGVEAERSAVSKYVLCRRFEPLQG